MSEEIKQIVLPETEQALVCDCEDNSNITVVEINEAEGVQECTKCLRFSKFPL